jgi:hypothetical protein
MDLKDRIPKFNFDQARITNNDDEVLRFAKHYRDQYELLVKENAKLKKRAEDAERDNKILSRQISDYIKNYEDKFRKAGM